MSGTITKAWNFLFDKSESMWNNFNEDEKIAFSRLIREIALSDKITLNSEFDDLDHVHKSYLAKANSISLETAISNLSSINSGEKERLMKDLKEMAENDNHYSTEEKANICKIEALLN